MATSATSEAGSQHGDDEPAEEAKPAQDAKTQEEKPTHPYFTRDGRTYMWTKKGDETELANFTTTIAEELIDRDVDDATPARAVRVHVEHAAQPIEFTLSTTEFNSLSWVSDRVGGTAVVFSRAGRENLVNAIRLTSPVWPKREVYSHTGFVEFDSGWRYLTASGAIGADGFHPEQAANLPEDLGKFALPVPPTGDERVAVVRQALTVADVGATTATVPVLATAYGAPLEAMNSTTTVVGPTGNLKSAFAAVVQSHMGHGFTTSTLPANFDSTANANMLLAFHAKGAVLVVDEFVPRGTDADRARMNREGERLVRAVGNRSGRKRLRRDSKMMNTAFPRCAAIITGEEVPGSQSAVARQFIVPFTRGTVNPAKLARAQALADSGVLAEAFAAYVQWLAPRLDEIRAVIPARLEEGRKRAVEANGHLRTPDIVSQLMLGVDLFLEFACDVGALTPDERAARQQAWHQAIVDAAVQQVEELDQQDPAVVFRYLVWAAISSGEWRILDISSGFGRDEDAILADTVVPAGPPKTLGYLRDGEVLLDLDRAMAAAHAAARSMGVAFSPSRRALQQAIHARSWLTRTDKRGGKLRYSLRRKIGKQQLLVLHLDRNKFHPDFCED